MENTKPRILAYQLAHAIPDHELEEISGGGGASTDFNVTFKMTGPLQSLDVEPDYRP